MVATNAKQAVRVFTSILSDAVSGCQAGRATRGRLLARSLKTAHASPARPAPSHAPGRSTSIARSTLIALAPHLAAPDRELVLWIVGEGRSCAQASTLLKTNERCVQRRVRRLIERLSAPEFAYAVRQIELNAWDRPTREVARRCVLLGRPVREVADALGMTQHAVRARRGAILAMARGVAGAGAGIWKT